MKSDCRLEWIVSKQFRVRIFFVCPGVHFKVTAMQTGLLILRLRRWLVCLLLSCQSEIPRALIHSQAIEPGHTDQVTCLKIPAPFDTCIFCVDSKASSWIITWSKSLLSFHQRLQSTLNPSVKVLLLIAISTKLARRRKRERQFVKAKFSCWLYVTGSRLLRIRGQVKSSSLTLDTPNLYSYWALMVVYALQVKATQSSKIVGKPIDFSDSDDDDLFATGKATIQLPKKVSYFFLWPACLNYYLCPISWCIFQIFWNTNLVSSAGCVIRLLENETRVPLSLIVSPLTRGRLWCKIAMVSWQALYIAVPILVCL